MTMSSPDRSDEFVRKPVQLGGSAIQASPQQISAPQKSVSTQTFTSDLNQSSGKRLWHHGDIRNHILRMFHEPEEKRVLDKQLAKLMTVDKMTLESVAQVLYNTFKPPLAMGQMGLRGHMEALGAPQDRILLYARSVIELILPQDFPSMERIMLAGYFRTYANAKEIVVKVSPRTGHYGSRLKLILRRGGGIVLFASSGEGHLCQFDIFSRFVGQTSPMHGEKWELVQIAAADRVINATTLLDWLDPMSTKAGRLDCQSLRWLQVPETIMTLAELSRISLLLPRLRGITLTIGEPVTLEHLEALADRCPKLAILRIRSASDSDLRLKDTLASLNKKLPDLVHLGIPLDFSTDQGPIPSPYLFDADGPAFPEMLTLDLHLRPIYGPAKVSTFDLACLVLRLVDRYCMTKATSPSADAHTTAGIKAAAVAEEFHKVQEALHKYRGDFSAEHMLGRGLYGWMYIKEEGDEVAAQ